MNELLGLAVLTGPLWLFLLLLPISIWVAVKLSRKYAPERFRYLAGIGIFLIVFFLPLADEFIGRAYFNYLCATQAGVKVYQTVELPKEYWDERGRPIFFNQYGNLSRDLWVKELDESGSQAEQYSSVFSIDKSTTHVKHRASQTVLAQVLTFRHWGGWMRRNLSPHNTADSCRFIDDPDFSRSFYAQLFRPVASAK